MSEALPSQWKTSSFGDAAQFLNGFAFKPHHWATQGTPIIRIAQMLDPSAAVDRYRGELGERFQIRAGDLLFSWSATLATVIWDRPDAYLNQHLFKVLPTSSTTLGFIHHLLNFHMEGLTNQSHGTTMRHITRADLLPYPVRLPPLDEQRHIAEVLDTIDDVIQKTEQLIAKLKQMKQGLLHDLLTRGVDDNGELRDPERHPEQFKDSPLGRIPKTWDVERLDALTSKIVDGVHHTPTYVSDGVPFLTVENLARGPGISLEPCRYVTRRAHDEYVRRADPRPGDVLVSKDGTLGVARLIPHELGEVSIFVSVAMLRPRPERLLDRFLREFFDTKEFFRQLGYLSAGSGLKHIHLEHFREFLLALPPVKEQERILAAVDASASRIDREADGLRKLRTLKSGLMEDLLTGRVRTTVLEAAA